MSRRQARYVKGKFKYSLISRNHCKYLIHNQNVLVVLQTLNIPDAYQDERFDPAVSTRIILNNF